TNISDLKEFIRRRASHVMHELGIEQDIIESVLFNDIGVFSYRLEKAKELFNMRNDHSYKKVQEAFTRVLNIEKQAKEGPIQTNLFETDSERTLYDRYVTVRENFAEAENHFDAKKGLESLSTLSQTIEEFFEHNIVMTDDERVLANRLALLFELAKIIRSYAHIDKIEWKQTF